MFERPVAPSISPLDVGDDMLIVDVRETDEWLSGHVPGSLHMPMASLPDRLGELPADRPLALLCHVGARSEQVTAWLVAQGYDAVNVEGGILAWWRAGRPVEGP